MPRLGSHDSLGKPCQYGHDPKTNRFIDCCGKLRCRECRAEKSRRRELRRKAERQPIWKTCLECGAGFTPISNQKYCSQACRQIAAGRYQWAGKPRSYQQMKIRAEELGLQCSVDDCTRFPVTRGCCPTHYQRLRITGDPLGPLPRKAPSSQVCARCGETFMAVRTRAACSERCQGYLSHLNFKSQNPRYNRDLKRKINRKRLKAIQEAA